MIIKLRNCILKNILTIGKVGYLCAPGTVASFLTVAVHLYYFAELLNYVIYWISVSLIILIVAITCLWILDIRGDPQEVVIDEVIGQLTSILLVVVICRLPMFAILYKYLVTNAYYTQYLFLISSFLTFRLIDIAKPGIIKNIDANTNTRWSILLDDILAGMFSSILTLIIIYGLLTYCCL